MKVEICFKDFLQRDTNEKKIKTPRKIMASTGRMDQCGH